MSAPLTDTDFTGLRPASREQAFAAGLLSPRGPSAASPAVTPDTGGPAPVIPAPLAPAAPAPTVSPYRVVGGPVRSRTVPLVYPVGNGEDRIAAVVVRRMSVAEVRDWTETVAAGRYTHLPMFERMDGRPIPAEAFDALDHDDWSALDKAALDFLPLALRGQLAESPASGTGDVSQR